MADNPNAQLNPEFVGKPPEEISQFPQWDPLKLRGPNIALVGPPGSGKTYSLATLVDQGMELGYLSTEPGGDESLIDSLKAHGCDMSRVRFMYVPPANPDWSAIMEDAKKINTMTYEQLTELKTGISKMKYGQFMDLISALSNFKCDFTGKEWGPVDHWPNHRAFVLDSLSGLNIMAMDLVIGSKPAPHPGEWSVAMGREERLINKLSSSTKAWFIMIAHTEMGKNPEAGKSELLMSALGSKLAPKLPRFFGDVILCDETAKKYTWSTESVNVNLKHRLLPHETGLQPDFGQMIKSWTKRYDIPEGTWPPTG